MLHANLLQLVLLALLIVSELLEIRLVFVLLDITKYIMQINQELANLAAQNVLLVKYLLLNVLHVTQPKIEFLESINMEFKLAYVILVSILLKMDLVFNQTVTLIHSAHNANKDFNFVFNVLPLKIELSSFLKASVYAWTDFIQILTIIVLLVQLDV